MTEKYIRARYGIGEIIHYEGNKVIVEWQSKMQPNNNAAIDVAVDHAEENDIEIEQIEFPEDSK